MSPRSILRALAFLGLPSLLAAASTPYLGTAISVPGTVQAEYFDLGGEGVAYHDAQPGQIQGGGAVTRTSEDVELEVTGDAGGGYHIGFTDPGDWLLYTLNVASSGVYQLELR